MRQVIAQLVRAVRPQPARAQDFIHCPMDEADRARVAAGLASLYLDEPTPPPTYSHADLSAAWRQVNDARAQWEYAARHLERVLNHLETPA